MRVLHVLGELRPSGGEVMLRDAVETLREHGVETIVLSTGDHRGAFANEYQRLGVETLHLPFSKSMRFAMQYFELVRRLEVEVVHIHTERANAVLGLTSRIAGARVVRTIHSIFSYTGRLRAIRTMERAILRAAGVQHVAIGPSVEQNERQRLRNPTQRVDNWIGPRFRPPSAVERAEARAIYGLNSDAVAITSIGNCSPVKNHGVLLEALPTVANGVGRPIVYLHAGSGVDEADERLLADEIASPGIEVRFLGSVADVRPLLWATDVYCMPSLYEGVGIAALEALACGVPSVLANVSGLQDVHGPAPNVRFVEPSAASLASGLLELLYQLDLALGSSDAVSEEIRAQRNMDHQVRVLKDVYVAMGTRKRRP